MKHGIGMGIVYFALFQALTGSVAEGFAVVSPSVKDNRSTTGGSRTTALKNSNSEWAGDRRLPKIVVFDLDGCLWRPEMYELLHFSGGAGAPFTPSEHDDNILLTRKGERVYLLGDVREVMQELYLEPQWKGLPVGISSRTDQPDWARELLKKFKVDHDGGRFVLDDVVQGPIQISYESKVNHFQRIKSETGLSFEDMLFFDNEYGNCEAVSALGVTVAYCPGGVTKKIWKTVLDAFPVRPGQVFEL